MEPLSDLDQIHALTQRVVELEIQLYELDQTHHDMAQTVLTAVCTMATENSIGYAALQEICDLRTGSVAIAEDAIQRIHLLRESPSL